MTLRFTIGVSASHETRSAVAEAVGDALRGVRDPVFALVFSTDQYDAFALAGALSAELYGLPWAGCSTAAVFANEVYLPHGLVVGIFSGSGVRVGIGHGGPIPLDPREAGRVAVERALASLPARTPGLGRTVILLPDGLAGGLASVVRGAVQEAGVGLQWAGGSSGNNLRAVRTVQFVNGNVHDQHVVAIALDTPSPVGIGIRHGWLPYGPPTLVTGAHGDVVSSLDYENAFEMYCRIAAERGENVTRENFAAFAMTHPFGIPQPDGEYVIRDPLEVLPNGSMRCTAEVPNGCLVRVMRGDEETILAAASDAAVAACRAVRGPMAGAIVFDCVSRHEILGPRVKEELQRFRDVLGVSTPLMGCVTLGEIGALGRGLPQFHNKSVVLLALPR